MPTNEYKAHTYSKTIKSSYLSPTSFTPLLQVTIRTLRSLLTVAVVTCAPARTSVSIIVTASISSVPLAIGTKT